MSAEIIQFKRDNNFLFSIAERRKQKGDYCGAVSAYRSILETTPFDYDANAGLAEIYSEIDLCNEAVNCWFRALSSAKNSLQTARAYNGLGANYYFLAKDVIAFHYFGEQLERDNETDFLYNDVIEEIQQINFSETTQNKGFRVVYDKNKDYKGAELISMARALSDEGKINEAIIVLSEIKENSPKYKEGLELISFLLILSNKFEEAIEVADHVLYLDADSFTAKYALCSAYKNLGEIEKSKVFYDMLVGENYESEERLLYMIMLSVDVNNDVKALEYTEKLLAITPYNINVLYLRGLIKYNLGDTEGCVNDLKTVLLFSSNAVVKKRLEDVRKPQSERPERFEYEFDIKSEDVKFRFEKLKDKFTSGDYGKTLTFEDIVAHCNCVIKYRNFDMLSTGIQLGFLFNPDKMMEYLKCVLVDAFVSDEAKVVIIREIMQLGKNMTIKCVIGHLFKSIRLDVVTFSGYAAELFNEVYTLVASNLYIIDPSKIRLLKKRIELCKDTFEENCGLDTIQPQAIAAALFYLLKISMLSTKSIACTIFGITENQLNDALLLLEKRRNYEDS